MTKRKLSLRYRLCGRAQTLNDLIDYAKKTDSPINLYVHADTREMVPGTEVFEKFIGAGANVGWHQDISLGHPMTLIDDKWHQKKILDIKKELEENGIEVTLNKSLADYIIITDESSSAHTDKVSR